MTFENFEEFLGDKGFNVIILNAIDSCLVLPESEGEEEEEVIIIKLLNILNS